jgi:exonuclease SbcD
LTLRPGKLAELRTDRAGRSAAAGAFHGTLEVSTSLVGYDNTGFALPAWADVRVHSELSQLE